ncbi:MAG: acylphosphatase [Candidatus Omnitrophica bacterium]|nr:acylphosphatase [Candidatus Omnitrophota bacterium]
MLAHILYSGNVQGVGFRFTAVNIAKQYDIKGWVRNLPGGQVEILAESTQKNLDTFRAELEDFFRDNIFDKQVSCKDEKIQFKDFRIAY